jgi:hypothetical protein
MRALLGSDGFYDTVLPQLFRGFHRNGGEFASAPMALKQTQKHNRLVYHLGDACEPAEMVEVAPWWDLKHPVWVCRDSYRPEVAYDARHGFYCESASPPDNLRTCGCGPYLFHCAKDADQKKKIRAAHAEQLTRTFQWVIQRRQPFSTVLTAPFSVRSSYAELLYARYRYYQTGAFQMDPAVDGPAAPRPHDPAFAAGVLGIPAYTYLDPSPRHTLFVLLEDFLCHELRSTNVEAVHMFEVSHAGNGRIQDHSELALKTGCRNCHATLEHGLKALWPLGGRQYAYRPLPERVRPATTRFYLRDHTDLRGEGPATLSWLGATLAAQPEFRACMVKKVEQLIYGGHAPPAEVHRRLAESFGRTQDMWSLFEEAFVARAVEP